MNIHDVKRYTAERNKELAPLLMTLWNHGMFDSASLPQWEQDLFFKFLQSVPSNTRAVRAQLYQDLFVDFILPNHTERVFLEFGATDGVSLSNTYYLELKRGWTGGLGEPNPVVQPFLLQNRPKATHILDCIWEKSGEQLEFFASEAYEFSTLKQFLDSDKESGGDNYEIRTKQGKLVSVPTISLNEVMERHFGGQAPDYISIDTEGSELTILSSFDFSKYRPKIFTVEHNYTRHEHTIDQLMEQQNYSRLFGPLTAFDAWYVANDVLQPLKG